MTQVFRTPLHDNVKWRMHELRQVARTVLQQLVYAGAFCLRLLPDDDVRRLHLRADPTNLSRGNLVQNWRTAQMPATCLLGQSGLPGVTAAAGPAVAACTYALLDQVLPADMTETQSGIPG